MRRFLASVLVALVAVVLVAPAQAQEGTGIQRVVDITFPLPADSGYAYVDTYDAPRSGHTHWATDIMADKMVTIHAVVGGEICYITGLDEEPPSYGFMIRLCGDDGFRYSYVHINNDTPGTDDGAGGPGWAYAEGLEEGTRVERGQFIAYVGDSGNAEETGPHLHFEIYDEAMTENEGRINPYFSLQAAEGREDFPAAVTPMRAPEAEEESASDVPRVAGATRIETAVELSRLVRAQGPARAVVIVPAGSHVEALVAAPLAALIDAPILLSNPDGLSSAASDEVDRLDPISAYLIGTSSQIGDGVAADLAQAGVQFQARLEAPDRYTLSALVAEEIVSYPEVQALDEVFLALGDAPDASRAWPDALSASSLAAATITPILLTEGSRLPDAVADFLTEHRPGRITVVGGTAAISEDVAMEAAEVANASMRRLAGDSRYATSAAVADEARAAGLDASSVWVATGLNYPDALAAGPAAALSGSPLLLIDGQDPAGSPASSDWLASNAQGVLLVGGTAVITDAVAEAIDSNF